MKRQNNYRLSTVCSWILQGVAVERFRTVDIVSALAAGIAVTTRLLGARSY